MFFIQPFSQPPRIRSVLGFMSLATRWGEYLFPGITVLTRDLRDLKAMHDTALKMRVEPINKAVLERFQSKAADEKIASRLKSILHREGIDDPAAALTQKKSYWQRYGNTFNYFDLISVRMARSTDTLRNLIFSNKPPLSPSRYAALLRHSSSA